MSGAQEVTLYTCEQCGDRCRSFRPSVEVARERIERLPQVSDEDLMIICHECWTANRASELESR